MNDDKELYQGLFDVFLEIKNLCVKQRDAIQREDFNSFWVLNLQVEELRKEAAEKSKAVDSLTFAKSEYLPEIEKVLKMCDKIVQENIKLLQKKYRETNIQMEQINNGHRISTSYYRKEKRVSKIIDQNV